MYKILTDVASDISYNLALEYDIDVLQMNLTIDQDEYCHTVDYQNLSFEEFYNRISNGSTCKTSQINPGLYYEYFKEHAEKGLDILYICLSAALSNSYNSAMLAKEMIENDFDSKVLVVDSISAGPAEALLAILASNNRNKGTDIDKNYELMNSIKNNINLYFTLNDLSFLVNGGRLSKSQAFIGSTLKLKPIISVDSEGKVVKSATIRSSKGAIKKLLALMEERIINHQINTIILINTRSDVYSLLKEKVKEKFSNFNIIELNVGPFVGCHIGDSACGVCFIGKNR